MWSQEILTRVQTTTRPDHIWPEVLSKIGKIAQNREKQEWKNEKAKLDNARRLRGIHFIDPDHEESIQGNPQNARKKLERPMDAATPCKKDLHAKDFLRWPITIWFTNLFLCHKRWTLRMQKQQWLRSGRSSKEPQHGNWRKSSAKRDVILDAHRDKTKVHFASMMDMCHFQNAELEPKLQKYQGRVVHRGDIVNYDSGAHAFFLTEQGLVCVPNDCRKSNGCYCKNTRLWRTSS